MLLLALLLLVCVLGSLWYLFVLCWTGSLTFLVVAHSAGVGRFVSEKLRNASYKPVETLEVSGNPLLFFLPSSFCYRVQALCSAWQEYRGDACLAT